MSLGANQSRASQRGRNFCEEVNSHVREHIEVNYRASAHHIVQTIPKPQESSERSSRQRFFGPFALECQAFRLQRPSLIHMSNEGHDGRGCALFWTTTRSNKDSANLRSRQKTNLPSARCGTYPPTERSYYAPVYWDSLDTLVRPKVGDILFRDVASRQEKFVRQACDDVAFEWLPELCSAVVYNRG